MVADNDGGGIFSFLPQATEVEPDRFEQLFGTPHGVDPVALATAHGLPAAELADLAELPDVLGRGPRWCACARIAPTTSSSTGHPRRGGPRLG